MGQVSKKERRRQRQAQKRKEAARRRQEEQPFFAAFRRMLGRGWGCELEHLLHEDYDPEEFRGAVEHVCSGAGVRPGSPDSWQFLAEILEYQDAPPDELLWVAHKWANVYPRDPRPHALRVHTLVELGLDGRAARASEEALAGPAGGGLLRVIEELSRDPGLDAKSRAALRRLLPKARAGSQRGSRAASSRAGVARGAAAAARRGVADRGDKTVGPAQARTAAEAPPGGEAPATCEASITLAAPVVFLSGPDGAAAAGGVSVAERDLLERLRNGPHDSLEALDLARRGAEMLAEDRYDRLLSLSHVRGVKQLSYQTETVLRVLKRFHGRVLLADEVGLGKTIEACWILKEYLIRGQVRRALILVPPALVGQWQAELEEKFAIPALTTHDPRLRRDPEAFWGGGPVLVASLALARSAAHRDRLAKQEFDLVIVDEAHHLKNRATRGWELVNSLRSRFFLMLTATPVETNLKELYNLVTLLRPGTLGTEAQFRRRFVSRGDPTQPRDPERLRELLREVMVRNTRALCGVLLPPRTARTLVIRLGEEEESLYELVLAAARRYAAEHRTVFRLLLEEAGSSPLAVAGTASRARARVTSADLRAELARIEERARAVERTAKLDRLAELLPGGKVLVFSRFRATLDSVAEDLGRRGIPYVRFDGSMTALEKDRVVEAFSGPELDVMLCSEIGGEGRNLQFCHRLINFDLPWNPMQIEQRIGRIHRIGQSETVEVTNLAGAGTAEERILQVLDQRVNLFELVVGEMDLLLGEFTDERDFGEEIFDIYLQSRAEQDVEAGFDELAEKLLAARGRLERTKALEEALFGEGYEA